MSRLHSPSVTYGIWKLKAISCAEFLENVGLKASSTTFDLFVCKNVGYVKSDVLKCDVKGLHVVDFPPSSQLFSDDFFLFRGSNREKRASLSCGRLWYCYSPPSLDALCTFHAPFLEDGWLRHGLALVLFMKVVGHERGPTYDRVLGSSCEISGFLSLASGAGASPMSASLDWEACIACLEGASSDFKASAQTLHCCVEPLYRFMSWTRCSRVGRKAFWVVFEIFSKKNWV